MNNTTGQKLLEKYDPHTFPLAGQASHIYDKLYISDWTYTNDPNRIIADGYDLVVSITNETRNMGYYETLRQANVRHIQYYADDCPSTDLTDILDLTFKNIESGNKVLVHCYAGASRSPAVGLYWMCKKFGMTLDRALEIMINKRSCVYPQFNYLNQILKLLQ